MPCEECCRHKNSRLSSKSVSVKSKNVVLGFSQLQGRNSSSYCSFFRRLYRLFRFHVWFVFDVEASVVVEGECTIVLIEL